MKRQLGEIAHARAGDKGNTSILMIGCYDPTDFPTLTTLLTADRVAAHFGNAPANIDIHPIPGLHAMTITVRNQLHGGVTRATTVDPHGKSLSGHLLQLPLIDPEGDE